MPSSQLTSVVLDASMDAVVTADRHGRITGWNATAEAMFGFPAAAVLGRSLGDTIIPAHLQDAHRAGLARSAAGAPGHVPGARTETTGQRADGTLFPVELTITRISDPRGHDDVTFVGFLRDISERHRLVAELRDSRTRLIAASDDARRRVERDLHDGAQQQLVALAIALRGARRTLDSDPRTAAGLLDRSVDILTSAIDELRELARGVHNETLTERGLGAALAQLARRCPIEVVLTADVDGRLPALVETSVYYLVAEALTNATKYGAHRVWLEVSHTVAATNDRLLVGIVDDGPGGADPTKGSGLTGMAERVEALGGTVVVESRPDAGTTVRADVPLPSSAGSALLAVPA